MDRVTIFISSFFLILVLYLCFTTNGNYSSDFGYSKSSSESKKNGVFISNYYSPRMVVTIPNQNINLKIKEIYREYRFRIGENNEIIPLEESQLIIKLYDSVPDTYYLEWKIGDFDNVYFTGGIDYFDANLSRINKFDTIRFEISKARYSDNENEKIGELILIEK